MMRYRLLNHINQHFSSEIERNRIEWCQKLIVLLQKNRADLIGVIMADVGKTMVEADTEVSEAIDFVQFYLKIFYGMD